MKVVHEFDFLWNPMLESNCKVWKVVTTKDNLYTNSYEPRYLVLILSILLLCILDVHYTLNLLQLGGVELNPIMIVLLEKNVALSLVFKYLITASGLIFLLVHKNFRIFGNIRVSGLIYFVFILYIVLVLAEAYAYSALTRLNMGLHF